jgi:hypothetical protein
MGSTWCLRQYGTRTAYLDAGGNFEKEKDEVMLMGGGPFVPAPFETLGQLNVFRNIGTKCVDQVFQVVYACIDVGTQPTRTRVTFTV